MIQGSLLGLEAANRYREILEEKNKSIALYKKHSFERAAIEGTNQEDRLQMLRDHIDQVNRESETKLNQLLLDEFSQQLGIKFEQAQLNGKPKKRLLTLQDIERLKPFHWGYHFDTVIEKRGGFDAIITNPPWETFQPDAKEFFSHFTSEISKKKMSLKSFETEMKKLLKSPEISSQWLDYQSQYNHQRNYFRFAEQYKNQVPMINGKRHGKDVNLYKLFECIPVLQDSC